MRIWRETAVAVCGLACLAIGAGCAQDTVDEDESPGALLRLTPAILKPGEPFSAPLVESGTPVVLKLLKGALPDGLLLDEAGSLKGTPTTSGQLARFTVGSENVFGDPFEQMDHVVAVGVRQTTLSPQPYATRAGDVLRFEHDWGKALLSAWAWDAQLGLVWPMRAGAGFEGTVFAPAGAELCVVVAGEGAQGIFIVDETAADENMLVLAQLTWAGDVDIDLSVLPQIETEGPKEVNAQEPLFEQEGQWLVRHEVAENRAPGPEVLTFAKTLPAGRWVLVATKAAGADVDVPLWLSVRRRDGLVLAERSYDALFSDVSTGWIESDLAAKTQSFKPLGVLVVGIDRDVSFQPPTDADLYGATDSATTR